MSSHAESGSAISSMTNRIVTISLNAWKRFWRRFEPDNMHCCQSLTSFNMQNTWTKISFYFFIKKPFQVLFYYFLFFSLNSYDLFTFPGRQNILHQNIYLNGLKIAVLTISLRLPNAAMRRLDILRTEVLKINAVPLRSIQALHLLVIYWSMKTKKISLKSLLVKASITWQKLPTCLAYPEPPCIVKLRNMKSARDKKYIYVCQIGSRDFELLLTPQKIYENWLSVPKGSLLFWAAP